MLSELDGIETLLDNVNAEQSALCALKLACLDEGGKRGPFELFNCEASWTTRADPKLAARGGPRHQTLRRRGVAPPYHRPIDLTRGTKGRLVMLREGLALEPEDARLPSTHISAASIRHFVFFSDAIKIIHNDVDRTLIACGESEKLDLLFEAHF